MLDRKLFDPMVPLVDLEGGLSERAMAFHDHIHPASAMTMDSVTGNLVVTNGTSKEHSLQDQALALLATKLQIPITYLRRCPAELRAENTNHWLRGLGEKPLLVRFDGEEVRAILTDKYVPVDNLSLIRNLRMAGEAEGLSCTVRYEWTPTRFVCQAVSPRYEKRVLGEEFLGGIALTNSEVGFSSVGVEALVLRLICTNGMVVREKAIGLRKVHRSSPERLHEAIARAMTSVAEVLPQIGERIESASQELVPESPKYLRQIMEDAEVSEEVIATILEGVGVGETSSRFDLINAITAAGNDPAHSLSTREDLQHLGGRLLLEQDGRRIGEVRR